MSLQFLPTIFPSSGSDYPKSLVARFLRKRFKRVTKGFSKLFSVYGTWNMQVKARSKVLLFLLTTFTQLLNSPVLFLSSELFSFSLNSGRVKHRQSICTPVGSRPDLLFSWKILGFTEFGWCVRNCLAKRRILRQCWFALFKDGDKLCPKGIW